MRRSFTGSLRRGLARVRPTGLWAAGTSPAGTSPAGIRPIGIRPIGIRIGQAQQILRADLALFDLGQFDNEVDDLILEDRGPQVGDRLWSLPIEIQDLALVTRMPPRFAGDRLVELVLGHGDIVAAPDFGKEQPQPDPAFRDPAIVGLQGLLVFGLVGSLFAGWGRVGADLALRFRRRARQPSLIDGL